MQSTSDTRRGHSNTRLPSSTQYTEPFANFQDRSRETLGADEHSLGYIGQNYHTLHS
jgi:hypothetical protein